MTVLSRRATLGGLAAAGLALALPARAAETVVTIKAMKFTPANLTIKAGDSVTFANMDGAPHTATADGGSFDTGKLKKGQLAKVAFGSAGDFPYHCSIHSSMTAVIHVT